ncbi:hypothetical protein Sjap_011781 [Stephania japonica]|uniref:Uncharacterized protein n=1 Tax=Stephania japonica TaxID=461633 RepID=A0AAP0JC22_9MAGN
MAQNSRVAPCNRYFFNPLEIPAVHAYRRSTITKNPNRSESIPLKHHVISPLLVSFTSILAKRWAWPGLVHNLREGPVLQPFFIILFAHFQPPPYHENMHLPSLQVHSQDAVFGLAAVSKEGCDTAWKWLKACTDRIECPQDEFSSNSVYECFKRFASRIQLD